MGSIEGDTGQSLWVNWHRNICRGGLVVKVLYATDGFDSEETAAKAFMALGPPEATEVTVVSVIEPPSCRLNSFVPPPDQEEWLLKECDPKHPLRQRADRAVEQGSNMLREHGSKTESMIRVGHAPEQIVQAAEETKANLIVVGARSSNRLRMFPLGSVSQMVIEYAPCSVLAVRPVNEPGPASIERVILATDGSKYACKATKFLAEFRVVQDADILILYVLDMPRWMPWARPEQLARNDFEQVVEYTLSCLMTKAKTSNSLRYGDPSEQILSAASETEADLIVLGSRGYSGIQRFLLGSVSQRICQFAERSVLVVRQQG